MPPRSGRIAHALGPVRRTLEQAIATARAAEGAKVAQVASECGPRGGPVPVVVAWSGGPDSAALLGLVELLVRPLGLAIVVGHVDHGLRPDAADEADLVAATARRRGHEVRATRIALASGPGLAARARDLRRAALLAHAREVGAAFVLLGHTATDQVETMLLHACRGAGLRGLSAMAACEPWTTPMPSETSPEKLATEPRRHGSWLRPLLHLSRADTRRLALELAIPFVDDPTNLDRSHPRVAIREEVLPILRRINPEVEAHFESLAKLARDAEQAIAIAAAPLLEVAVGAADTLDVHALRRVPKAVRAHALRTFCEGRGVPPDALHERTLASIEAVVAGVAAEPGRTRRWDLHPYRTLCLEAGHLRLVAGPAQEPAAPADEDLENERDPEPPQTEGGTEDGTEDGAETGTP